MNQPIQLFDILSEITLLQNDILNYELQIRGIQPTEEPTIKKLQLAHEILKEEQGTDPTFSPFMATSEDLRDCASLYARFDSMINSTTRPNLSIETALINLAFLKIRVERLNSPSNDEIIAIDNLRANIMNAIERGREMFEFLQNPMIP